MAKFTTFSELVNHAYSAQRVTYRIHGMHGELRKPMFHRFPVRGGISMRDAMIDTISMRNPLFEKLSKP